MEKKTDATLNEINIDDMGRMLMALVQEVWIMRDRMAITERLLAEKAGITADQIENYVADTAMSAELEAMRDRYVARVIGAPIAARERSVAQILERAGYAPEPAAQG